MRVRNLQRGDRKKLIERRSCELRTEFAAIKRSLASLVILHGQLNGRCIKNNCDKRQFLASNYFIRVRAQCARQHTSHSRPSHSIRSLSGVCSLFLISHRSYMRSHLPRPPDIYFSLLTFFRAAAVRLHCKSLPSEVVCVSRSILHQIAALLTTTKHYIGAQRVSVTESEEVEI